MIKPQLAICATVVIGVAASTAQWVHARHEGGSTAAADKTEKPKKPPPDKTDAPKGATQPTKGGVSNPCLENPKLPDCPKAKPIP